MNYKKSASYEASTLIEAFLVANPQPTPQQWKELTMANSQHAAYIADAALMLCVVGDDIEEQFPVDPELFNATRSAMLSAVEGSTAPIDAARTALKQCRGPAARKFARQIGLGEHVDLFNQMVSGEVLAPYVLLKRLALQLQIRLVAMKEVFSLNFQYQQIQAFKADGKPTKIVRPVSWENAVRSAGINGDEASRLLHLVKELD